VIATKYTLSTRRDDPNAGGNHRKNMVQALEASLRRLRTDYVDLLWLHMWDGLTPVEEVLRAFDDLVRAGKVLYVGFSDTPAWVVSRAHAIASVRGWTPPSAVQLPLSLADRGAQRDLLPMARGLDLAVCAWGTLEGGTLTGKYFSDDGDPRRYSGEPSEAEQALAREVMAVAEATGSSPAQVAINWVRQQPGLVIPIIGARTEEQAQDNLASLEHELTSDQLERLTQAAPLSLGFPHSFLASDHVTQLIFGETRPLIDVHRAA
jgi:aryl-alcohol dehydrogenase-like predicted oxidoreductase